MPNIRETLREIEMYAGGPGSGRKPGFGSGSHASVLKQHGFNVSKGTNTAGDKRTFATKKAGGEDHTVKVFSDGSWSHYIGGREAAGGYNAKDLAHHLKTFKSYSV